MKKCHRIVRKSYSPVIFLSHIFHISLEASDGIRQSPLGDSVTEPTFGPSGRQERLNCWMKNRLINVVSHLWIVSESNTPANV